MAICDTKCLPNKNLKLKISLKMYRNKNEVRLNESINYKGRQTMSEPAISYGPYKTHKLTVFYWRMIFWHWIEIGGKIARSNFRIWEEEDSAYYGTITL